MIRISIQDEERLATLKIEGKIAGPWAAELSETWKTFAPSLGTRKLRLDIRGVTFVDREGKQLLQEICRWTDAEILADTPMTKHFAEEATRKTSRTDGKDDEHA